MKAQTGTRTKAAKVAGKKTTTHRQTRAHEHKPPAKAEPITSPYMRHMQTAIRGILAVYYVGGAVKLWTVAFEQTRSIALATGASALLLIVSLTALFDLRVHRKSREVILWLVKLFVAYLYTQHLQASNPYLCFGILVLMDALAHLLLEHSR